MKHGDETCPVCGAQTEMAVHLFGGCGGLSGFWGGVGLEIEEIGRVDWVREWVEMVWKELGEEERVMFMTGCYAIWEGRNKVVFEGERLKVADIIKRVRDIVEETRDSEGERVMEMNTGVELKGWKRPAEGVYKINVDAGVLEATGTRVGIVCRGADGVVVWGMEREERLEMEPREAEAMAVMLKVQEALNRGLKKVMVEDDCLEVIEALKNQKQGRNEFYMIISDILELSCNFTSIAWSFVGRKFNRVAHGLAHARPWRLGDRRWDARLPENILNLVEYDSINSM
ncbi:uncharacterized protein LOC141638859 [Silene latifolia]|uniref:uncharacterized protein LOC141638859 n=1 Tax=Silene latifolia TaxID=37657 RepID=UPI003D77FD18